MMRLPFGVAPAGHLFQQQNRRNLQDLPNIFVITDDIYVVGFEADGRDHEEHLSR